MGYDVARKHDLATIWIDGIANKVYRLLALMVFRNCKFETQKQIAESIMRELPIVGAGDETGMGGPNCEHLHTLFPDRFIPVNFSSKKITLGTMLMEVFEQGRQELPFEPPMIAADIAGIRKDTGVNGKLLFTESPNPHEPESHCDMGWGCGLSKFAGETIVDFGPCLAAPASTGNETQNANNWMRPERDERQPDEWTY
jgi:phage FluMu gp28-like protein